MNRKNFLVTFLNSHGKDALRLIVQAESQEEANDLAYSIFEKLYDTGTSWNLEEVFCIE